MKGHHVLYESTTRVNYNTMTSSATPPISEGQTEFSTKTYFTSKSVPSTSQSVCKNGTESYSRPPFITTVTKGKFLPSKFDLFVERNYFTFSSRPRPVEVLKKISHSSPGIRADKENPRGVHDYFNLMWDPHVVRGSTIKVKAEYVTSQPKAREATFEPTPKFRKKRSNGASKRGNVFPTIGNGFQKTGQKEFRAGRFQQMVQTDQSQFLEELGVESSSSDAMVQTDKVYNLNLPPPTFVPVKLGVDASTQILPGDLFNFDTEVEPILDSFIQNILEQGITEVIEEEELLAIREQRNRFEEERRREEKALQLLQEQKERITLEKERLEKEMELELIDPRGNGGIYSTNAYFLELLPSVLEGLRQEGLLNDFATHENGENSPQEAPNDEETNLLILNNKIEVFEEPIK